MSHSNGNSSGLMRSRGYALNASNYGSNGSLPLLPGGSTSSRSRAFHDDVPSPIDLQPKFSPDCPEALESRPVDVPLRPTTFPSDGETSKDTLSGATDDRYGKIVMPLDVGWFPSPLFLGMVVSETKLTPTASSQQAPRVRCAQRVPRAASTTSLPPPLASSTRDDGARHPTNDTVTSAGGMIPQTASATIASIGDTNRRSGWWRKVKKWWGKDGNSEQEALDNAAAEEEEDAARIIEREIVKVAHNVGGRGIRGNQMTSSSTGRVVVCDVVLTYLIMFLCIFGCC